MNDKVYSQSTIDLLNDMMKELKFGTAHQNSILNNLHRNKPILSSTIKKRPKCSPPYTNCWNDINFRHKIATKRTLECIVNSGAYETDMFIPSPDLYNVEHEKTKLASLMAYGEITRPENFSVTKKSYLRGKKVVSIPPKQVLISELAKEIDERIYFVEQMKTLNSQKSYGHLISQQIAEKLRTIEKLLKNQDEIFVNRNSEFPR